MDLNNKNVFVTGADGFIGSHLTETLLDKGCRVKALSYYNSFNNWGWLEDISDRNKLEVVNGDIRDPHFCKDVVKGADIIFHLAALIAIPYSYLAPDSYVDTNVRGTLNICQAARENGNIRVIHTSTSEVYGTARYVPIDENHPKQAQSPYSASKIGADAMAMSFYSSFGLPVTIARPFNTYGPRQSARAIIPTIITQIASGAEEIIAGNLEPTRDLNYVQDICKGFLALAESENTTGKEINISSNTEYSIGQVAELIMNIMGRKVRITTDRDRIRPEKSEVYRLKGDNTLFTKLTAYVPEYSLEEGLKLTCSWFSNPKNLRRYKPLIYNV